MQVVGHRYRVAVHEAGHAVAARLLGLRCGEAAIAPRAYARVPVDLGAPSICAIYAGSIAEALAFGSYDPAYEGDRKLAEERLERLGYSDGGEELWRYTVRLLRPRLGLIMVLALRLDHAGTLDGAALDRIVARG